ncbi:unnamed protein product [Clavelina lepadiformis]|uniref:Syndetin n=1 Tax=Clavelina lepadiformis TaxID=159417 RepID=A0ABP0F3I5_CLALP
MKKIRGLFDNVGKHSTSVIKHQHTDDINIGAPKYAYKDEARRFTTNPQADREAIESIDKVFYGDQEAINPYELDNLPEALSLGDVEVRREKLRQQVNAISKKLSDVILENQPSYTKELKDVQELQRSLHNAFIICSNGRRFLMSVSTRSTTAGLKLLASQQKRHNLLALCTALETIRTLQHTDIRLREMLEEEDYDGAIQLCLECQKAASTYRHYHCIKDLSSKLQDTLEQIEEQMDVALSKTCKTFDENVYAKLKIAYQLLGKTQSAMDQLLMHYTTCIHNTAFHVVLGFAELGSSKNNLHKKQYKDLCTHISGEIYIPCLMEMCKALWSIMHCYHKTSVWHKNCISANGLDVAEEVETEEYINRKLSHGRHRIWADVQSRIRTYILSCDLSVFKYDDFITVLDIVKRFILVGVDFCRNTIDETEPQTTTDNLNEPLRKQTLSYFYNHHKSRLEELLMFLDNEAWQPCPVKSSFEVLNMQEFKFLRQLDVDDDNLFDNNQENFASNLPGIKYFDPYTNESHPFADLEKMSQKANSNDIRQVRYDSYEASDEDDMDDELHQEYIDERTGESPVSDNASKVLHGPIMTNTALHVLRLCGSYLKMCDVLKPIAIDVVVCMTQLFDLYFYAVFEFFSTSYEGEKYRYERLTSTIKRMEESLFLPISSNAENEATLPPNSEKIARPTLSPVVDLNKNENNYGIMERIVATESLICLSEQFQSLQKYLELMIPQSKKAFLHQFYSQTVRSSADVRWTSYWEFSSRCINMTSTIEKMFLVNWDIKDIMSQHNAYVDQLLKELGTFKSRLQQSVRSVQMPEAVSKVIWNHCIRISNQVFVEGFSNVKKCSNEGRALMQLDYQQFLMKFEKLANIRPIPNREYVEAYIKAYYLTENDLENWMRTHIEYTPKQLSSLVNCSATSYSSSTAASTNRNAKQRMMSLIEELTMRK